MSARLRSAISTLVHNQLKKLKDAFHKRHEQLYTYFEPNTTVEVVNLESALYGIVDKPSPTILSVGGDPDAAIKDTREAIFSSDGKRQRVPVYDGDKLGAGDLVTGPAIIEEITTTIVIEPDWHAELHKKRILCGHAIVLKGRLAG